MALLRLSFKPNTDDLRVAPSLQVARALLYSLAARVVGHDPIAGEAAARRLPEPKVVFDPYDALTGAHAAIVVTEWKEFRELDLKRVASLMNSRPCWSTAGMSWTPPRLEPLGSATGVSSVAKTWAKVRRWRIPT